MRRILSSFLAFCLFAPFLFAQPRPTDERVLMGFSRESSANQKTLEARFDAALKRENLRQWMKRLSARPHYVGSPYDKENAEFMASLFKSWGYETQIESFEVLFPTPKTRLLEMIAPVRFTAKLAETALVEYATYNQQSKLLQNYYAFSIDGDVTGGLFYVN